MYIKNAVGRCEGTLNLPPGGVRPKNEGKRGILVDPLGVAGYAGYIECHNTV